MKWEIDGSAFKQWKSAQITEYWQLKLLIFYLMSCDSEFSFSGAFFLENKKVIMATSNCIYCEKACTSSCHAHINYNTHHSTNDTSVSRDICEHWIPIPW